MKRKANKFKLDKDVFYLPIKNSYKFVWDMVNKAKKSMPYVYNYIESLIKAHIISVDRNKGLSYSPKIDIANIITKNVIEKIPNIDEESLKEIINDKSSKSFLDLLTRGTKLQEGVRDYSTLKKRKLFEKILIANRGEIALRIIRACRELGIEAIVIYSKTDKDGLAVKFADKAYCINSANAYLNIKKIIKIAKKAKVDAMHPGYGFLAENAKFVELCNKNKIKFIGPTGASLDSIGNKAFVRRISKELNIPVIPGSFELIKTIEETISKADELGYPVILKAAAGGGGKGIKAVNKKEEIEKAFEAVKVEAKASFNDDSIYIEKYIEKPRHIEFQILADRYGNVLHLGERECSIQRRHQKLVEEAPSPALTAELREKMGEAAKKIAKFVNYEGAGTVEFLLDKDNNFYFMEMNTRIQVEHGITEMVTGVDLVKEQIKLAAGAKIVIKQEEVMINGYAIECRINAENPADDFNPSTGMISNYIVPGGPGIRVCSSCHSGHTISPQYDSMIAKLICYGKTREEAIARTNRALNEYVIKGVETTIPFHLIVLTNENFVKGNLHTSFIEENKIIEKLKKKTSKKPKLTEKEKVLIVSTAVSKYLEKRPSQKINPWVMAARQEQMQETENSF